MMTFPSDLFRPDSTLLPFRILKSLFRTLSSKISINLTRKSACISHTRQALNFGCNMYFFFALRQDV